MITNAAGTIIIAIICLLSAVGAFAQNKKELAQRLVASNKGAVD